ncbi:MAG: 4Fe-4S dicluster domain-containing protein [Phycisphaerae bacterium]
MATDDARLWDRRGFFHSALRRAATPLANYLDRYLQSRPGARTLLRPPGALEEARFLETCQSCASCVEACPAVAISLLEEADHPGTGTPVIDADKAACVVCEGLQCTHVCPSGALQPVHEPATIRMGLAELYEPLCERTQGEPCTICVDRCPIGEAAISIHDYGPPRVSPTGCVGCGVCQLYCPTTPKAIVVIPVRDGGSAAARALRAP